MKHVCLMAAIYSILAACNSAPRSGIEKIFVDSNMVKKIESKYNARLIDNSLDSNFRIRTIYITKTGEQNAIERDTLNHIRSIDYISDSKDSLRFDYYPNGQAEYKKGLMSITGKDSGVMFYSDGRIGATGHYQAHKNIGEWKFYDSAGYLRVILHYDDDGKIIDKKLVN